MWLVDAFGVCFRGTFWGYLPCASTFCTISVSAFRTKTHEDIIRLWAVAGWLFYLWKARRFNLNPEDIRDACELNLLDSIEEVLIQTFWNRTVKTPHGQNTTTESVSQTVIHSSGKTTPGFQVGLHWSPGTVYDTNKSVLFLINFLCLQQTVYSVDYSEDYSLSSTQYHWLSEPVGSTG